MRTLTLIWIIFTTLFNSSFAGNVTILTGIQIPKEQLRFATVDINGGKTQDLLLDPNPKMNLYFTFYHPKVSLSVSLPAIDGDKKAEGHSQALDFRFKSKFGKFLPDLYFQKYKGFEVKDELNDQRSLGFLSQVETLHFGGNLTYFISKKLNSIHSGHEFFKDWEKNSSQKQSNSSLTLSVGIDHLKVFGLPDQQMALKELRGDSSFQTLSFRGGGVIQYFRGPYVFEGTAAVGPGVMRSKTQNLVENIDFVTNVNVGFLLGARLFKKYSLTLTTDIQILNGQVDNTQFSNQLLNIEFGLGRSF